MATTTNYSWTTPDDTDLVKDGAAAIRTLGSSADTTVKALNPGTTAGDIDYYTTSTAKARVGIGTAGQVLQVNSGATAPEWATPSSGGMTLISTTTLTGASVTLSSIPATYNDLYIIVRNFLPATDSANLRMRFNADSGANRHRQITYETAPGVNTFNADLVTLSISSDNAVTQSLHSVLIPDYKNTTTWKMANSFSATTNAATTTSFNYRATFAFYNQTAAISSLEFFLSDGNFTSGSVLLYGVK
jgi:hypothetical protein